MSPLIPQDKANHLVYGAVIGAVVLVASHLLKLPPLQAGMMATGVVAAIGAIKELADRRSPAHTPDVLDFVATLCGGLLVVVPYVVGAAL